MKVFLTGGSGYIGRATIAELARAGHTVEALARSDEASVAVEAAGATAVRGGLADLDVLASAAGRADAVIHLAQAMSGEEDLAAAQAMAGSGPYVHTGGTWVYGNTGGVRDETAPWHPPAVVAWRKPVEEAVLAGTPHPVIIRPGLLYGGENRLIEAFFVEPGRKSGAIPYIGDGENHWALIHVTDLARLYVAALSAGPGSVYVGVGGVNPTAKQVAAACAHAAGLDGKTVSITIEQARAEMGPIADAFVLDQEFTPAKAQRELGWEPRYRDPLRVLADGR